MKLFLQTAALLTAGSSLALSQVVLNEVRIDDPGSDDFEYFEIFNRGQSVIRLDTISYVVLGKGAGGSGVITQVLPLPPFSLEPGSYFVGSNNSPLKIDPDSDGIANIEALANFQFLPAFENSSSVTHLLAIAFSGSVGDDLDTNDDGTLDVRPWVGVADAISFYAPGDSLPYARSMGASFENVGPDENNVPSHLFRVPDGGSWIMGTLGQEQDPGSGNLLQDTLDTPGNANPIVTPLLLTLSESSISEGAASPAMTGTVTRSGTSGDIVITLTIDDESEAVVSSSVTILDGESSADFTIDAVNDLHPDGAQSVTVSASGENFEAVNKSFVVTDDSDSFSVVINEVFYANDPDAGDTNNNGTSDSTDHFIELVNVSGGPVDLSDFHLENSSGTSLGPDGIHRFAAGTILNPGCGIAVFDGPGVEIGTTETFGTAEIQISSSNGLFLSDTGDHLRLLDDLGNEVFSIELPDISGGPFAGSQNLTSEGESGDPALGYDSHFNLSASNDFFSPGTTVDGAPFCTVTGSLEITLLDGTLLTPIASIPENAFPGSVVARIEAPTRAAGEVVRFYLTSSLGELIPQDDGIGQLDDENSSIDWLLDPVDNTLAQGSRNETLSLLASGHLNAVANIVVTDDGDLPPLTEILINEIDADQSGQDGAEFVELYNLTEHDRLMDGLVLVLINGNGDSIYHFTDLAGFTIPAHGVFVIGDDTIPNVDLTPPNWTLQNGSDAVAIYQGTAEDFTIGMEISTVSNTLLDAVVYDTNDGDDDGLLAALTPGQPQVNEGGGGGSGSESIQRLPDGGNQLDTSTLTTASPTPGALNFMEPVPDERFIEIEIDVASSLMVVIISNLRADTRYTLEATSDGNGDSPFVPVTSFTTTDRNVTDDGEGVFQVYIFESFLDDLVANPRQIYRVTKP
jgi:hypothetical protein